VKQTTNRRDAVIMTEVTPALGLSATEIHEVLAAASLAPSVHNSQPWRFRLSPNQIELHADLRRRLPATDPEDRELRLSCGAALLNLKLALRGRDVRPLVTLPSAGGKPSAAPLAVVRHGGRARMSPEDSRLLQAVPLRRTNRKPFADSPVPSAHRAQLARAADAERGWLHVVSDRMELAVLHDLVVRAHRIQSADPRFLAELGEWTGHGAAQREGVPVTAGGPRPEPQDEWVLRDFTAGQGRSRVAGKDFEPEPLLVVLCAFEEGPRGELQAGQALQRVLLTATALGLSASFLAQPVEVPEIRRELGRVVGTGMSPLAILRIGYGSPVQATPRRPVTDLIMPEPTRIERV
jgi:nitroreductase